MMKNTCTKCNHTFSSASGLKAHMNRKTPCDVKLICANCNKVLKTKISYDNHVNSCISEAKQEDTFSTKPDTKQEDAFSTKPDTKHDVKQCINSVITALKSDVDPELNDEIEDLLNACAKYLISHHTRGQEVSATTEDNEFHIVLEV